MQAYYWFNINNISCSGSNNEVNVTTEESVIVSVSALIPVNSSLACKQAVMLQTSKRFIMQVIQAI